MSASPVPRRVHSVEARHSQKHAGKARRRRRSLVLRRGYPFTPQQSSSTSERQARLLARRGEDRNLRCALLLVVLALFSPALGGCSARPIKDDDPLADRLDARRYLGLPLSCTERGFTNVFGPPPPLTTGTPIRVVAISIRSGVYLVQFSGPDECSPHCTVEIDASGRQAPARFDEIFAMRNPLSGLDEEERAHVAAHQVAAGMRGPLVRLSLGEPDRVESIEYMGSPADRWVYDSRRLDERGDVILSPRLALVFVAGRLLDYEDL